MQPFTSDSVLTTPFPSTSDSVSTIPSPSKIPPSAGKGIVYIITCSTAPGGNQSCSERSTNSAMIAVSAVSLLLNITLATVILIHCLLMLRRKKPKDHSTNSETYAEPIKQVDVSTAPNEAYGLHKITKPSEEDTTYEMVK